MYGGCSACYGSDKNTSLGNTVGQVPAALPSYELAPAVRVQSPPQQAESLSSFVIDQQFLSLVGAELQYTGPHSCHYFLQDFNRLRIFTDPPDSTDKEK